MDALIKILNTFAVKIFIVFIALASTAVNATTLVGSTPGQFAVSPSGAATYSIPIQVPPGIAGMQPELSLNYNSQAGNGLLGVGWSLGGLSAITRCPTTLEQDGFIDGVDFDSNDKFCLDGQRLIAVSGAYGADGTEYRTEIDSFSKIVSYGSQANGPAHFIVWTKSGQQMHYGVTSDSRIEAQGKIDVLVWAINQVKDSVHNYYTVSYTEDNANGDYYPIRIEYTANDAQGITFFNAVEFVYTDRGDVISGYVAGSLQKTTKRLTNLKTYTSNNLVKNYSLHYENTGHTQLSRITSLTECEGQGFCLPAVNFGWETQGTGFGATVTSGVLDWGYGEGRQWADFNGDGLADYCRRVGTVNGQSSRVQCTLSTGAGFGATVTSGVLDWGYGEGRQWVDFNGDGLADYCRVVGAVNGQSSHVQCTLSTGAGFGATVTSGVLDWGYGEGRQWVDFNGDGLADYCRRVGRVNGQSSHVQCTLSTGAGFGATVTSGVLDWGYGEGRQWVDFNGDGLADYCRRVGRVNGQSSHVQCTLSTGAGFGATVTSGVLDWGYGEGRQWVDFNGDGLADYCRVVGAVNGQSSHVQCTLSTGAGFGATVTSGVLDWGYGEGRQWVDFNGDGLADYCRRVGRVNGQSSHVQCTLSTGAGFGATVTSGVLDWGYGEGRQWVDFNGDGLADYCRVVGAVNGQSSRVQCTNSYSEVLNKVKMITDSFGVQSNLSYKPLTDINVYTKGSGALYPEFDFQGPMYVVSQVTSDNGIGGSLSSSYQYEGMKVHLRGRGNLGFAKMTVTDDVTGSKTVTDYRQDWPYSGLIARSETLLANGTSLLRIDNSYSPVVTVGNGSVPVIPLPSQTVETINHLGNDLNNPAVLATKITTTNTVYDAWGNLQDLTVNVTGNGHTYTTHTHNQYGTTQDDAWLGRLTRSTVSNLIDGQTDANSVRVSAFEYDSNGLLSKEILEPNKDHTNYPGIRLTTAHARDSFGNITQTTVCDSMIAPAACVAGLNDPSARTTTTSYASNDPSYVDGQFATSITNSLGHTETRVYDARFGAVASLTGPNGLTTTLEYDSLGRKIKETRADGTQITITYAWCEPACPTIGGVTAKYKITTQASGSAPATIYADAHRREIRKQLIGFGGQTIFEDREYDAYARLKRVSKPYFAGDISYWATSNHDLLGRITSIVSELGPEHADAVMSIEYAGFTTITTDPKGRRRAETTNALGQTIQVSEDIDNLNVNQYYTYDSQGNLTRTQDQAGNTISLQYDARGRKIVMDDPDMGHWIYAYNAFSQLISQTDALNQTTTMNYDQLGRLVARTGAEGPSVWVYDSASGKGIGKPHQVFSPNSIAEEYSYDALGRVSQKTQHIDMQSFTTTTNYDAFGRVSTITYPTGFAVNRLYNNNGFLEQVQSADGNTTYWQADQHNALGQIIEESLNNGNTHTSRVYNTATGWLEAVYSNTQLDSVQWLIYNFDQMGNLANRRDELQSLTEAFTYDSLDRLTQTTVSGGTLPISPHTYSYNALGNITYKSDIGSYTYGTHIDNGAGPHAVTQIVGNGDTLTYEYDANGNMTAHKRNGQTIKSVQYTSFNKPFQLSNTITGKSVSFVYAPSQSRVLKVSAEERTKYIGLGATGGTLYEHQTDSSTNQTLHRHFIYAYDEQPVAQYVQTENTQTGATISQTTQYFHRDHLGSVDAITDAAGSIVTRKSFDAWGQRRNLTWDPGPYWTSTSSLIYADGHLCFTGHEQIDEVGLIHMNGRVYDPTIGRFLSADPNIQAPKNTQSFNRYTYVFNNPLRYTDPSGFFLDDIADFISNVFNDVVGFFEDVVDDVKKLAKKIETALEPVKKVYEQIKDVVDKVKDVYDKFKAIYDAGGWRGIILHVVGKAITAYLHYAGIPVTVNLSYTYEGGFGVDIGLGISDGVEIGFSYVQKGKNEGIGLSVVYRGFSVNFKESEGITKIAYKQDEYDISVSENNDVINFSFSSEHVDIDAKAREGEGITEAELKRDDLGVTYNGDNINFYKDDLNVNISQSLNINYKKDDNNFLAWDSVDGWSYEFEKLDEIK